MNKGLRAHHAGQLAEARQCYEAVLHGFPRHPQALNLLGLIAVSEGRTKEGIGLYQSCLQADPKSAAVWSNLGMALLAVGDPNNAVAAHERAIALEPGLAAAYNNLGTALQAQSRLEKAERAFARAVELQPDLAEAWSNLGHSLLALNKTADAMAAYGKARRLEPDSPEVAFSECLVNLVNGNLLEAWEDYERRWDLKARKLQRRPSKTRPAWDGRDSLAGQPIVVYSEQGLGDTIQFARYIPLLAERGAQVHVVVQPPLQSLIGRIKGVQSVSSVNGRWPDCDLHCPLLSLPRAFGTDLSSIPERVPYLAARPDQVQKTAMWLASAGKRRIGVVWSGNPAHLNDRNRSMPVSVLSAVLASAAPRWVSLQKEMRPGDAAVLRAAGAVDLSSKLMDFEDTAGVLAQLDLLISVDTSVAHLAGAMGIPTWILLPYAPDWRWLLGREDNPWYPTVRLFRQSKPGDWDSVMTRVADALTGNHSLALAATQPALVQVEQFVHKTL
jgi:tetratricopeptide (TPR) repeat protein